MFADEKAMCVFNPLFMVEEDFFKIKTKTGELLKLKLNKPQRYVVNFIKKLRAEKKPVRLWILKGRQQGVSTLSEAMIYALTSQQDNRNSLIMGDQEDKSEYLFQMSKLYHEELRRGYPHLAPPLKKSNAKMLEFEDQRSQIIIETAKNINAARAYTYTYVHLSEVATFPDLTGVLTALMQSVPNYWDTMVIGETTANGMNEFYEEWKRAEEGKTDWIPVFIPWFWSEEYSLPLENSQLYPIAGMNFGADNNERKFLEEEQKIKAEFNLTAEQLNWRRWCIVNNCKGDINIFKQEYPSFPQEAFVMSGENFFDRDGMNKQKEVKPVAIGEIFYDNMEYRFRDQQHGRLEIFAYPTRGEEYLVVLDAAEGTPGRDEAAALVLDKALNDVVAVAAGPYTPEELTQIGVNLAHYYREALLIPENKGYGYMVCQLAYQKYGNIYRKITNKTGQIEQSDELGFNTNAITRPTMLARLNDEIKYSSTRLASKRLIDECRAFIVDPKSKKPQAQNGKQDGLVMCRAIAGEVRAQFPSIKLNRVVEEEAYSEPAGAGYGGLARKGR